jgi:acetoin utilization protein AcuB
MFMILPRARELMTKSPKTVEPETTVRDATRLLETLAVRHLPVVDKNGALVGMITDRDLHRVTVPRLVAAEATRELREALDASVATLMSPHVISVGEHASTAHVVGLMLENKIGAVPVVDGTGVLVGIVSYMDVLRHLSLHDE